MLIDLNGGTISDAPVGPAGLIGPDTAALRITHWKDELVPKVAGRPIPLGDNGTSRAVSVRPDRTGFVLGADFGLLAFSAEGKARWRRGVPSVVWGANLARDGDLVIAAYADGTVRWHRWRDGQELLALFVDAADRRWVAWTPTGYYMASPGGEDMIGWHVNRGWEQEPDFFSASRFRDRFNRPDVVQTVLQTLDEAEALRQSNAKAKRRDDQTPIMQHLPPVITILSPSDGTSVTPGPVEVRYRTRTPSGGKVDRIDTFVDGAKIQARGLGAAATEDGSGTVTLAMPAHNAVISLVAYAGDQASDAARVQLRTSVAEGVADGTAKPTLYALLVGVSHYEDADLNLGYAAKDASDLADVLKAQSGRLYGDVQVKVLTDGAATSVALKDGLAWLAAHATDRDLELLFVAGHGITDAKGRFWFLTYDADPARVSSTAVSRDDITGVLYDLPGKKLMFLDACHSGAALEQAGARGLERSGADLNKAAARQSG